MIVKISRGGGRWLLLSDVRGVDWDSTSRLVTSQLELRHQIELARRAVNGCPVRNLLESVDWGREPIPYRFGSMILEWQDGLKEVVLFDHPVYLCDDQGATVERVSLK